MNIHQVLIVPGFGHTNDAGEYDRGRASGRVSETDIIDGYLPSLMDELDVEDIRWALLDTRSRPGVKASDRPARVEPGSLVLHCLAGWADKQPRIHKNFSQVLYSQDTSYQLADEIGESIGQWGQCWAYGHKTANPRKTSDPLLEVAQTRAIAIEPFLLNGPDAENYWGRLDQLGVVIARALSDHLRARSYAQRGSKVRV